MTGDSPGPPYGSGCTGWSEAPGADARVPGAVPGRRAELEAWGWERWKALERTSSPGAPGGPRPRGRTPECRERSQADGQS